MQPTRGGREGGTKEAARCDRSIDLDREEKADIASRLRRLGEISSTT